MPCVCPRAEEADSKIKELTEQIAEMKVGGPVAN